MQEQVPSAVQCDGGHDAHCRAADSRALSPAPASAMPTWAQSDGHAAGATTTDEPSPAASPAATKKSPTRVRMTAPQVAPKERSPSIANRRPTAHPGGRATEAAGQAAQGKKGGTGVFPKALSPSIPGLGAAGRGLVRSNSEGAKQARMQSFKLRHGEEASNAIQKQKQQIEKLLADKGKGTRYVLHPEKNKYLGKWDMVASFALLYTATLTPFETGFTEGEIGWRCWTDPWFVINRVLDVIFPGLDPAVLCRLSDGQRVWRLDVGRGSQQDYEALSV